MTANKIILVLTLAAAICGLDFGRALAADDEIKVPRALAEKLAAAQKYLAEDRAQQAVETLLAYDGEDHALRHLVLGHAYAALEKYAEAAAAYRKALEMRPDFREAGLALAQVYAQTEKWRQAAELLGRFVATDDCEADALLLYAQTATQMGDARLAKLLTAKGIARFPSDMRFRRQELVLLAQAGETDDAAEAARAILARDPVDPVIWQYLAFAKNRDADEIDRLAALEAALLCEPESLEAHRNFLGACLAAGDWLTVARRGRELLAGPLAESADADERIMELLIQAADMGGEDETLAEWLARIEPQKRTRAMQIAAVRLALRHGESQEARTALNILIEKNQADAAVFLWAARLAEEAEEWPEAEALYERARKDGGRAAKLATLYLARMHIRCGRPERAIPLLEQYLNERPEDSVARALLALAKTRSTRN